MSLDRLVIENFKSYAGNHVVGPFRTFTAVIGPNGAGKSNLMDAISFVLGVRTLQLRGSQLKDLIHKKEKEHKKDQARDAFVELIYRDKQDVETSFKRSIFASGTAKYSLDGKVVKWDAYNAKLKSIGVLVKARNFLVFQGDVELLAQKSPGELTALFEEISGSVDLKVQYDECKEAAQLAEEEFMGTFEMRRTMNKEKKQIKEQKDEAERFQELLDTQKELKTEYFLWQLFNIDKDLNAYREAMAKVRAEIEEKREAHEAAETEMKSHGKATASARKEITTLEKAMVKQTKVLDKRRPALIKIKEQISFFEGALGKTQKAFDKIEKDGKKQQDEISELEAELKETEEETANFEEKMASESVQGQELKLAANQLTQYNAIKDQVGTKTAPLRQKVEQIAQAYRMDEENVRNLDEQLATLAARREQLTEKLSSMNVRKEEMMGHIDETVQSLTAIKQEHDELQDTDANSHTRREELQKELSVVQARLQESSMDARQSEKDQKMADCLESLKTHFAGVRGRLLDLCKPAQKKFNLAVTIAMGKNMEAIVVDEEKVAIECIKWMKENRVGTATFIPLDTIITKHVEESHRQLGGTFKLVQDVIEYDESIQAAVQYACGNALLCEHMSEARALCFGNGQKKFKVVTLDGTVIHKSGNLTGGVGNYHKKANKWNEKEIMKVRRRKDELFKELVALSASHRAQERVQMLKTEITGLENRLKYSQQALKGITDKLAQTNSEIANIDKDVSKKTPEQTKLRAVLQAKQKEMTKLNGDIDRVKGALFRAFAKSVGVKDIAQYEEKRLAQAKKQLELKQELADRVSRLKNQIEYEKSRDMSKPLTKMQAKIAKDTLKLGKCKAEEERLSSTLSEFKTELATLADRLKTLKQGQEKSLKVYKDLKRKATQAQKEMTTAETRHTHKEGQIEQMKSVRAEVFRRCKLEDVVLPIVRKRGKGKQRSKKGKSKAKHSKAKNPRRKRRKAPVDDEDEEKEEDEGDDEEEDEGDEEEDEGLTVDFSQLPEDVEVTSKSQYQRIKTDYEKRIGDIAAEREKLAPNLKAIERFEDVKGRLDATKEDWEARKRASKEAAEAFEGIKVTRHKEFMKAFNHVSTVIDEIYKRLTQSESFPDGGKAYLNVETNDEPYLKGINYTAMPPMKRFRDMGDLSGGEQTVAALALLFAIHSFHPAPFFVMDEVDAALDIYNLTKVSSYIRQRAHEDGLQCVVISLKHEFYTKADSLVGIYKDQKQESSGALTVDLNKYDTHGVEPEQDEQEDDEQVAKGGKEEAEEEDDLQTPVRTTRSTRSGGSGSAGR